MLFFNRQHQIHKVVYSRILAKAATARTRLDERRSGNGMVYLRYRGRPFL